MNYKDMTRTVSGRTALTRQRADDVLVATLTVLAEQVSAEETRDLLAQLPKAFRERVPISGTTLEMRPIEFVARVADLVEGASIEEADGYVRAVFATLNEAVNAGEMRDIATELGADFEELIGRSVPTSRAGAAEPAMLERVGRMIGTVATLPVRAFAIVLSRVVPAGQQGPPRSR